MFSDASGIVALRRIIMVALLALVAALAAPALAQNTTVEATPPPDQVLGINSDADIWRYIRKGGEGDASARDQLAGIMIQSEGDNWRALRNGPLSVFGGVGMLLAVLGVGLFYMVRGKIRIEKGPAGVTIERFASIDRFAHWLMAGSFVVLALTGLNMLYGRYVLLPVIGPEAFSALTIAGKYAHNYLAFAFMAGLALSFILWVRHNIPTRVDWTWLRMGGGLFAKGSHPPARKFNAGQKILFWMVMLGGLSVSLSGIALMFPFQTAMFAKTFAIINVVGFDLPTNLTPLQEQQYSQIWHAIVSLVLIMAVIGHIYIGTVGMEGAIDAMHTGQVDKNWAKEHHGLWVAEMEGGGRSSVALNASRPKTKVKAKSMPKAKAKKKAKAKANAKSKTRRR